MSPIQPFLPAGAFPWAHAELLKTFQAYSRLTSAQELENGLRYQPSAELLDVLNVDVLATDGLQRSNWICARPRMEVTCELTNIGVSLSIFPAREALQLSEPPGPLRPVAVCDVNSFPLRAWDPFRGPDLLSVRISRTDVGMLKSLAPWGHLYLRCRDPHAQRTQDDVRRALHRRMLLAAVQSVLHKLTLAFDIRLRSELIGFGPDCVLELREREGAPLRAAGAFDPESGLDKQRLSYIAPQPDILERLSMCRVHRQQFEAFAREYLYSHVPAELHVQVLCEYLEMPFVPKWLDDDFFNELEDRLTGRSCHASRRTAFEQAPETLDDFCLRNPDWFQQLCELGMRDTEVCLWLARNFPDLFPRQDIPVDVLTRLMQPNERSNLGVTASDAARVDLRLAQICHEAWRPGHLQTISRRFDDVAKKAGFRNSGELLLFAAQHRLTSLGAELERLRLHAVADGMHKPNWDAGSRSRSRGRAHQESVR